jgi:hypothetical protein
MANQVDKINGLTLAKIQAVNGLTDANIQAVNGLEMVGTVDPSKISITNDLVNSGRSWGGNICYASHLTDGTAQNQIIATYGDANNGAYVTARVGTISGTTVTWGTEVELDDQGGTYITEGIYNSEEKRFMIHYHTTSGSNHHYAIAGNIIDKSIDTLGTAALVEGGSGYNQSVNSNIAVYNPTSDTMDCIYEYGDDSNDGNHIRAVAFTDTDTNNNLTVGDRVEFANTALEFMAIDYNSQRGQSVLVYNTADNTVKGRVVTHEATKTGSVADRVDVSGTASTTEAQLSTSANLQLSEYYGGKTICWNHDQNVHHVIVNWDQGSGYVGTIATVTIGTSNDFTWESDFALVQSGTSSSSVTGGGIVYNHARNRIITYGANSTSVSSQYNFEYHTYDGSSYTSQGGATTLSTLNGYFRGCGTTKTDTTALHATGSFMVNHIYDGSDDGDGLRLYCMDPGG